MKNITICGSGNWLELEILSRGAYRVIGDSIRKAGNPITKCTLLAIRENDDMLVLSEDEYVGVFVAEWQGVKLDFSDQENLMIFGSLKTIRKALEKKIITNACMGDE